MYKEFVIDHDPFDVGCTIFRRKTIHIKPGFTALVGCNGLGKTTLIKQLQALLDDEDMKYISYNNLHDGGHNARQRAHDRGDFTFLATAAFSSEGENIMMNLGRFAGAIKRFEKDNPDLKEIWIFFDAIDSGFSIDNMVDAKNLFDTIIKHNADRGVTAYIIVAANSYEMARESNCFDVLNCRYVKFADYDEYRNFIMKTREEKDARKQPLYVSYCDR